MPYPLGILTLRTFLMGFTICNLTLSHFFGRTTKKNTLYLWLKRYRNSTLFTPSPSMISYVMALERLFLHNVREQNTIYQNIKHHRRGCCGSIFVKTKWLYSRVAEPSSTGVESPSDLGRRWGWHRRPPRCGPSPQRPRSQFPAMYISSLLQ